MILGLKEFRKIVQRIRVFQETHEVRKIEVTGERTVAPNLGKSEHYALHFRKTSKKAHR